MPRPQTAAAKTVKVSAELTHAQAWQLAQLIKRITFSTVRECACNDDETYIMLQALDAIRENLREEHGIAPR